MRKLTAIVCLCLTAQLAAAKGWFVGDGVYVGDVKATNNLAVTNNATIGGNLNVGSNVTVFGGVDLKTNVIVRGNLYLSPYGPAYIQAGTLQLTNWIDVLGVGFFKNGVWVNNASTFEGLINCESNIQLIGDSRLVTFNWSSITNFDTSESLPMYLTNSIAAATNAIDGAFLAGKGALTNGALYVLKSGDTMSGTLDMGTNEISGSRFGVNSGSGAAKADRTNLYWTTVGTGAGADLNGGNYGDFWGAFGYGCGIGSVWTGSHAFGKAAGFRARGNNRLYIDVDAASLPTYSPDGSTNDTIFMDSDGKLYLGGGPSRSENPLAGGTLRGSWTCQSFVKTNDARYLGSLTNASHYWQHAGTIAASTSAYTVALSGPAVWVEASNRYDILPYSATNYGTTTGAVTITMSNDAYLSEVGGTWYYAQVSGQTPAQPVSYDLQYISASSAVLSAWCATNAGDAVPPYYAYFSNLVVYTYDRVMSPLQYTNDAAGIVARCDPIPTGNTDTRRVVNAGSLTAAIAAAKPSIAQEAWAYMPSGARQPSLNLVTLDKPLVQQGTVNYIQSGDYFAQSYHGVWDQTTTGGVWRIGPNGKTALEIMSTNIWLAISAFSVRTNVASFVIATNNVVGTPYIEYCADLVAAQWIYAAGQSVVSNATNWSATCPTVATMLFFRAVSPGGDNRIVSHYQHQFNAGIRSASIQQTSGGWNDLNFPAANIYTFGLVDIEYNSPSNGILFKNTCNTNFATDNAWVTAQLPHSIATNSALIYPHIHFAQDSATLTGAVFLIRYKRYAPGAAIPTTWTDLPTSNVFAYTSGAIHQIADTSGISGPFALSELFDFKIWYRGATGPVVLKFFDLHYQQDGLGSTTLYTKDF